MNFEPAFEQVLIKPDEALDQTKGGIYIPDTGKDRPNEGTVLAVGFDVTRFNEGEHVLYGKYAGVEVNIDDELLLMVNQKDILGKRLTNN